MQKADYLLRLMKQRTDALIASDEKLQQFLIWVSQKSLSVEVPYKPAAVRAFYLALDRVLDLDRALNLDFALALACALDLDFDLDRALALDLDLEQYLAIAHAFPLSLALVLDPKLKEALQQLSSQRPDLDMDKKKFKQWWKANGQAWTEQLRAVMIKHRNIGYDWRFSDQQKQVLKQFYNANKLLVDCLNTTSNVTPVVRSHIEEILLLPIAEIQKRDSCQDK
jgi:predicted NACHT family NTPase